MPIDGQQHALAAVAVLCAKFDLSGCGVAVGAGGAYLYPSAAILTAIKMRTALSTTQIGPPATSPGKQALLPR